MTAKNKAFANWSTTTPEEFIKIQDIQAPNNALELGISKRKDAHCIL